MASRKRAPLVHRPSNAESVDWRGACRMLHEAITDEEVDRLVVLVAELLPADVDLDVVLKLFAAKTGRRNLSESSRNRIALVLGQARSECSYVFPLVRTLIRGAGGAVVQWDRSCIDPGRLLMLEMAAWDSISEGQGNKRKLAETLLRLGFGSRFALEIGIAIQKPASPDCMISRLLEAVRTPAVLPAAVSDLATIVNSFTVKERMVAAGLLLNICVCVSFLRADASCNKICISTAIAACSSASVALQADLVRAQLGMQVPDSSLPLAKVIAGLRMGDSISDHDLGAENRYEVALVCQQLALSANCAVEKTVFALYALHCIKFSDCIKNKTAVAAEIGTEGFLSLLVSETPEKILPALVCAVPPLQRLWIALESVRLAAEGYSELGYVPGASWLLQRGLEYIELVNGDLGCLCADFEERFKQQLAWMHLRSPTAIPDDCLDTSRFSSAKNSSGYTQNRASVPERLSSLARLVDCSHTLHESGQSHLKRIQRVRNMLTQSAPLVCTSPTRLVQWTLSGSSGFVKIGSQEFKLSISDPEKAVVEIIGKFDTLLRRNKMSISEQLSEAADSKLFWAERKAADLALGDLFVELEQLLIPFEALDSLTLMHDDNKILWLAVPDLLTGLPLEAMPCFSDSVCVRLVPSLSPRDSSPRSVARKSYILNPNGDCRTTETSVLPILRDLGWEGKAGHPTLSDKEFVKLLADTDVFLYSGHGGGEKHWSGASVQRLPIHNGCGSHSVALLMGCSSAKPYGDHAAAFCTPFHYLIGGFRLVVGTLWDVLGRELDRMTLAMLSYISAAESVEELEERMPDIIHAAKRTVKLKNLSAASIVVYAQYGQFS